MKKGKKKGLVIGGIVFLLALVIIGIFYFQSRQAIITFGDIGIEQSENFNFKGIDGTVKTTYFGILLSGSTTTIDGETPSGNGWVICGDNDGKVTISNSYSSGESLIFDSKVSGSKQCNGNYMEAEITLPEGTLNIVCETSVGNPPKFSYSSAVCSVESGLKTLFRSVAKTGAGQEGQGDSNTESKIIEITEPTTLNIKLNEFNTDIGGTARSKIQLRFEPAQEESPVEEPTENEIPEPKGFSFYLTAIKDFLKDLFSGNLFKQSIIGSQNVEPNTEETYSISLTAPTPDSDFEDGEFEVQRANWGLFDKDGDLKKEGTWERVYGSYDKEVTLTTPSSPGDYSIVVLITQLNASYDFNTKEWTYGDEIILNKEAVNIESKRKVTEPEIPSASGFLNLLSRFWDWLKGWFN